SFIFLTYDSGAFSNATIVSPNMAAAPSASSPWRTSSHGLRDMEKCATETPRHRQSLSFLRASVPLWPMAPCLAGRVRLSPRPASHPDLPRIPHLLLESASQPVAKATGCETRRNAPQRHRDTENFGLSLGLRVPVANR